MSLLCQSVRHRRSSCIVRSATSRHAPRRGVCLSGHATSRRSVKRNYWTSVRSHHRVCGTATDCFAASIRPFGLPGRSCISFPVRFFGISTVDFFRATFPLRRFTHFIILAKEVLYAGRSPRDIAVRCLKIATNIIVVVVVATWIRPPFLASSGSSSQDRFRSAVW